MPRKPRDDQPGALLHLHNRGIAKRPVFETPDDVRHFESRIAREVREKRIRVLAFVIQSNHYHMLAVSTKGEVSEAMRVIQNQYVRRFNRSRGRDGPLFRGRFGSRRVDSEADFWTLIRYIDLHSVKSRITTTSGLYPFGSAMFYLRGSGPPWLDMSEITDLLSQGRGPYRPEMYERLLARPLSDAERELIELRMRGAPIGKDPIDDLIRGGVPGIHDWMIENARRADGTRPGLAIASPSRVQEVLICQQIEFPTWTTGNGRGSQDLWAILHAGLLRDACALTYQEIAFRTGVSISTAQRRVRTHRKVVQESDEYGLRCAAALADVLQRFAWSPNP